jgi:hypothetical protein
MVIRDSMDGDLQSMADGKWYDSKSALRRSYTADGNPQGRDYQEIGGTEIEPAGRASVDKKAVREARPCMTLRRGRYRTASRPSSN